MTDGIFAVAKNLPRLLNAQIVINNLPMKFDEISRFATKETSSRKCFTAETTVGCHMIVATKDVANLIIEDFTKTANFEPSVIGFIALERGPGLTIEADINKYVSSKAKANKLNF